MSDFLFDLNIKNYSIDELRGMLDLKIPYSEQEISEQTNGLKNKLLNVADLSETREGKYYVLFSTNQESFNARFTR